MEQNNNIPAGPSEAPVRWNFRSGAKNSIGNLRRNKYGHIVNGSADDSDDDGPEVTFQQGRDGIVTAKAGSVFDSPHLLEWAKKEYNPDAEHLFTERAVDKLTKEGGPLSPSSPPMDAARIAAISEAIDLDEAAEEVSDIEKLRAEADRLAQKSEASSQRISSRILENHTDVLVTPSPNRRFQKPLPIKSPVVRTSDQALAKFCPECGEPFDDEEKFCPECGTQRCYYVPRI